MNRNDNRDLTQSYTLPTVAYPLGWSPDGSAVRTPSNAQRCPMSRPPGEVQPPLSDGVDRPPKSKRKSVFHGPNGQPRNRPFPVRLSEDEYQQIATQAARYRKTMVAYIRARIFDYRLPSQRGSVDAKTYAELSQLILAFRNFGSNVNQLSHNLNLGLPVEVQEALKSIVQAREALDRLRLKLVQVAEDFEAPEDEQQPDEVLGDIWEED